MVLWHALGWELSPSEQAQSDRRFWVCRLCSTPCYCSAQSVTATTGLAKAAPTLHPFQVRLLYCILSCVMSCVYFTFQLSEVLFGYSQLG